MRDVALAMSIDDDVASLVELDTRQLETKAVGVRNRADGEHGVATAHHAAVVAAHDNFFHTGVVDLARDRSRARTLQQRHAAFEEVVFQHGRNFWILGGQYLLATDDQIDLRSERAEHVHKLDARYA